MANAPIVFYFDFTSPHSYLSLGEIQRVADKHGRTIDWRSVSVFKLWDAIDYHPIGKPKAKARYVRWDFERAAAVAGLPFTMPTPFPIDAVLARQLFWRIKRDTPDNAVKVATALIRHYWGAGGDISTADQIAEACSDFGISVDDVAAAESDMEAAAEVNRATEQAIADGAFGVPFFVADGELFWGHDRIAHIDWRLSTASGNEGTTQ